jgi:hypothetical protein
LIEKGENYLNYEGFKPVKVDEIKDGVVWVDSNGR